MLLGMLVAPEVHTEPGVKQGCGIAACTVKGEQVTQHTFVSGKRHESAGDNATASASIEG